MTNREKLFSSIIKMDDNTLAECLEGNVGEEISMLICRQCQKENNNICLMESFGLAQCPKSIAGWLKEEACRE